MSKFKVGDRVRCIDGARSSLIPGHIYIVKDSDNKMVVIEGTHYAFANTRFELVKEEASLPPILGEMSMDERVEMFIASQNGKTIQQWDVTKWTDDHNPTWWPTAIYRIKPEEAIPDSFDWSHATFNYVARDAEGEVYGFDATPIKHKETWVRSKGTLYRANAFASYKKGNLPWDQSLICRPGYKPK